MHKSIKNRWNWWFYRFEPIWNKKKVPTKNLVEESKSKEINFSLKD